MLVDARDVTGAPSTAELRRIAAEMKPLIDSGMGPIAIFTDSACIYGVARMFSVFAQTMSANVSAHRSPEDAEQWLAEQLLADRNRLPRREDHRRIREWARGTFAENGGTTT